MGWAIFDFGRYRACGQSNLFSLLRVSCFSTHCLLFLAVLSSLLRRYYYDCMT
ncbi:uncharacterized protein BDR25DRAFT_36741 [Lindgomyces ingoldianus]|uniref:Uncharacterized protein n=1 Tax=Lindgomyces ingoldianus TaxID=673940 RepID=A0ACB6QT46_9PLEO|nr:uncharacterized protein BDR25DRAFT_36741 [Lindgomyces ingoldianus]KAF2470101.1 hypothetical protein BDR25DRAFT_36741 [Lindgomyces ingoldianus]